MVIDRIDSGSESASKTAEYKVYALDGCQKGDERHPGAGRMFIPAKEPVQVPWL